MLTDFEANSPEKASAFYTASECSLREVWRAAQLSYRMVWMKPSGGILCMDQALISPPPSQSYAFPPREEPDMRDMRHHLAEKWEGRAVSGDERCEVLSRSPRRWGRGLLLPVATAWMCRWCAVRSLNTACVDKLCRFNVDVKFCSCAAPTYEYK